MKPRFQPRPVTSHELVRAAAAGDERAWDVLYTRYTPALRSAARGYRLSAADVDDVVQTTWLAALTGIRRLRNPEAVGAWLMTTLRREAFRMLQRGASEILSDDLPETAVAAAESAESLVLDAERAGAVQAAVDRLPDAQRAVIGELLRTPEVSYIDVARKLRCPVGSVGPTRGRGLERLRLDRTLGAVLEGAAA
jgi:RNA polymerase sigma factor (sigma-70 family)